ncbi:MAG: DUF4982 domain-containing protein [Lachnospiraceae bacterium]|nr:DUF4982 domain-containing protein [Lachnospiraceae bacterium]
MNTSSKKYFNDNWSFSKFPLNTPLEDMRSFDGFKSIAVPHDWMIDDTSDLYENSIGFYRKTFNLNKEENHTYIVRFGCVYMNSQIYLNNSLVGEWKYGYSSFEVDITDYAVDGNNTLEVIAIYENPNSRWYSGAGIIRDVFFFDKAESYIPIDGLYISAKNNENDDFTVYLDCEVISKFPRDGIIKHEICNNEGTIVASVSSYVPLCNKLYVSKLETVIKNGHRWDIDDPYLYNVKTTLIVEDEVRDELCTTLGLRTVELDPNKGLFLNGKNIKINGACQHHDLGALGAAFNINALRRQFKKLKEMGVNSVRTSHNMPAEGLLDAADDMGMLINTESFDMWEKNKTPHDYANFFVDWWKKDITSWVRQNRNHPSVFIWSIGNEIYDCHAGNGYKWNMLLRDAVRELDYHHNAFVGSGSNYMEWDGAQKCADDLEIAGYNYGERMYDSHHEAHPDWCIFGSETSSTVQSRGIYHFPLSQRLLTYDDGQCSCLGNCTTNWGAANVDVVVSNHRDRDFVFGQYIWTGWDYIGEPTPYFTKNSYFGQIDTAGFEKDTFYHYQAEWTDYKKSPMVHVLPYWDYNIGQIIDVVVYSNAPEVGLYLNDEFLGKRTIDHKNGLVLSGNWQIPYKPGTLKAVAFDENGNIIATDITSSFTDSKKIVLSADKNTINANPEDLIFVTISTVDESGNPVLNARDRVNVSVSGAGILVGLDNGDSTDYEQFKGTSRKLFSGKLLAIIASNGEVGSINVKVSGEGLEEAELTLNSAAAEYQMGQCFMTPNYKSEVTHDIPVRRITLTNSGSNQLNENITETKVSFACYPECATDKNVIVKALTLDGVEANFVKVDIEGNVAKVKALGDGDFRLTASAKNGSELSEIISELEFSVTGLGLATQNPYDFIPGIQYSDCSHDTAKLSFQGGVHVPEIGEIYLTYDNVDFGEFGSDEISLPIFIFENEMPLSVWEGDLKTGECLGEFLYKAETWYNHYQENTFKLSRRIKGTTKVTIKFDAKNRISLKGFCFKKLEKAYEQVDAVLNSRITGDSFTVCEDCIKEIGNNVSIEFEGMNFKDGISSVIVCGRSNNEKTSIHLIFSEGETTYKQMVEIPFSSDLKEHVLSLQNTSVNGKVTFVFLPGSNFDLKWFKFEK